jgi:HEPN domain-containing protein
MEPENELIAALSRFSGDPEALEDVRKYSRWIQRGIHHAQFAVEFGQTALDRECAEQWVKQAGRVVTILRRWLAEQGVKL